MTPESSRLYQIRRKEAKRLVRAYWSWKLHKLPISMIAKQEGMEIGALLILCQAFDREYLLTNRTFEEV